MSAGRVVLGVYRTLLKIRGGDDLVLSETGSAAAYTAFEEIQHIPRNAQQLIEDKAVPDSEGFLIVLEVLPKASSSVLEGLPTD